ncbi:MAG: tetratricopeptide repeat protein [Bacteroidota bacterium]|nr:tetratricopeptide repeat protein [Bacteroidota bacterium]
MKKLIITSILIFLTLGLFAQQNNKEYWRNLAYKAKLKGDIETSITNYKKVLKIDSEDYDAKLALAFLYYDKNNFKQSLNYYKLIYKNDNKDVEAINGFGRIYHKQSKYNKASFYFQKAINLLPSYMQQYFDLAQVYIEKGNLDSARITYFQIINKDNTYAEAWAGIGKMYYWENRPDIALKYYEKAISLDSSNEKFNKIYKDIKNELAYSFSATLKKINEQEESYEINAIVQKYSFNKRLNDNFAISLNTMFDYSDRDFANDIGDTGRCYDNSWAKFSWITSNNKVSAYFGYSKSDSRATSYGINCLSSFHISKIKFKNSFTAGYDYFYYWNQVGKNSISNSLTTSFKKFSLKTNYMYGVVDKNYISDYYADKYDTLTNPHQSYLISLNYKIFKNPKTVVAINHSFLDFEYKSPLYYTPYERVLNGISLSSYYSIKDFYFYLNFAYNIGYETYYEENTSGSGNKFNKLSLTDINSWNGGFETGYNLKKLSFSIGGSHYDNPYYKNTIAYFSLKVVL